MEWGEKITDETFLPFFSPPFLFILSSSYFLPLLFLMTNIFIPYIFVCTSYEPFFFFVTQSLSPFHYVSNFTLYDGDIQQVLFFFSQLLFRLYVNALSSISSFYFDGFYFSFLGKARRHGSTVKKKKNKYYFLLYEKSWEREKKERKIIKKKENLFSSSFSFYFFFLFFFPFPLILNNVYSFFLCLVIHKLSLDDYGYANNGKVNSLKTSRKRQRIIIKII